MSTTKTALTTNKHLDDNDDNDDDDNDDDDDDFGRRVPKNSKQANDSSQT